MEENHQARKSTLTNFMLYTSVTFAVLGLIILVWFFVQLSGEFKLTGTGKLLLPETGQVGDFIGGLVGSIWSFSGILLFYLALQLQRKEFVIQRQELVNQRVEFQVNRITNLIYKQLERIDIDIKSLFLEIKYDNPELNTKFIGRESLLLLNRNLGKLNVEFMTLEMHESGTLKDDEYNIGAKKSELESQKKLTDDLVSRTTNYSKLVETFKNSCLVIDEILESSLSNKELKVNEIRKLKNIFILNLDTELKYNVVRLKGKYKVDLAFEEDERNEKYWVKKMEELNSITKFSEKKYRN